MSDLPTEHDAVRSRYERLRLNGMTRSAIIAYGIGAYAIFVGHTMGPAEAPAASLAAGALKMFLTGSGLQLLVFFVRSLAAAYERYREEPIPVLPAAMFVFELLVDGVTVLLFALGTYQSILRYPIES